MTYVCCRPGCDRPAVQRPAWLANFQLCDVHQAELDLLNGKPTLEPPPTDPRQIRRQAWDRPSGYRKPSR